MLSTQTISLLVLYVLKPPAVPYGRLLSEQLIPAKPSQFQSMHMPIANRRNSFIHPFSSIRCNTIYTYLCIYAYAYGQFLTMQMQQLETRAVESRSAFYSSLFNTQPHCYGLLSMYDAISSRFYCMITFQIRIWPVSLLDSLICKGRVRSYTTSEKVDSAADMHLTGP